MYKPISWGFLLVHCQKCVKDLVVRLGGMVFTTGPKKLTQIPEEVPAKDGKPARRSRGRRLQIAKRWFRCLVRWGNVPSAKESFKFTYKIKILKTAMKLAKGNQTTHQCHFLISHSIRHRNKTWLLIVALTTDLNLKAPRHVLFDWQWLRLLYISDLDFHQRVWKSLYYHKARDQIWRKAQKGERLTEKLESCHGNQNGSWNLPSS